MKKVIILYFYFIILSCQKDFYEIKINFESQQNRSAIILSNNNHTIDKYYINDYYGKNKVIRLSENIWSIEYSERCGTGCSLKNKVLINIINNKIKILLHIRSFYKEKNFEKSINFEINNKDLIILSTNKIRMQPEIIKKEKLIYDMKDNVFFNKSYKYDKKYYKGICIDSLEYIYYKQKWIEFDSKSQKLYSDL